MLTILLAWAQVNDFGLCEQGSGEGGKEVGLKKVHAKQGFFGYTHPIYE